MREILFRAKRQDNGKWIEGYYIKATHHWHEHGKHEDWIATDTIQNGGWCNVRGKHAVISETVGQYTGLTDKNGTKIFEGDIVSVNGSDIKLFIEFTDVTSEDEYMTLSWNCRMVGHPLYLHRLENKSNKYEVVGNIHDNPELLKGE